MIIKKTGLLNKLLFTVRGWDLKAKYITLYDINQLLIYLFIKMNAAHDGNQEMLCLYFNFLRNVRQGKQ